VETWTVDTRFPLISYQLIDILPVFDLMVHRSAIMLHLMVLCLAPMHFLALNVGEVMSYLEACSISSGPHGDRYCTMPEQMSDIITQLEWLYPMYDEHRKLAASGTPAVQAYFWNDFSSTELKITE
jgi:hypothetical protein